MAENSKIEWCDHTFNPWEGCSKVSAGCKNCYAETRANRFGTVEWGASGTRRRTAAANWKKPLVWDRKALSEGRRYRVFCASLADVFEDKPDQPEIDDWRADLMKLIQDTPNLDWLLLTKRPENVMRLFDVAWRRFGGNPVTALPPNVWIGTSVENQEQANKRIPELLQIPAVVRFLSCEPLLGTVDFVNTPHPSLGKMDQVTKANNFLMALAGISPLPKIDWVIVGGESGANARPMHPDWVRAIRDQCVSADVPFFFKQWGEWLPFVFEDGKVDYQRVGKKSAGRLLAGRTWDQVPEVKI